MNRLRRRWAVAIAVGALPVALTMGFGHRGAHAARSLFIPGAGLVETHLWFGIALALGAIVATVAWLRWGTDWLVAAVVIAAMIASAAVGSGSHVATPDRAAAVSRSAHEFPLVIVVVGFLGWVRAALAGVTGFGWLSGRRSGVDEVRTLDELSPVERCRAATISALAAPDTTPRLGRAVSADDVARRARRVGGIARFRFSGDPLRTDHVHARTAMLLTGALGERGVERLTADCDRSPLGIAASEPGWVRTLDATLAATALANRGQVSPSVHLSSSAGAEADRTDPATRWAAVLNGPLALRRGHRPAAVWTPLQLSFGRCRDWEHAALTAIAHRHRWIDDADWAVLRRRVLGAAARGTARSDDERLIAAGRLWLTMIDDVVAEQVLLRPTVRHDPLAIALDRLASTWRIATDAQR